MTVSTTANNVVYLGNGATTEFAVPFLILDDSHLVVRSRLVSTGEYYATYSGTDYTYDGIGEPAGTLTLAGTALSADYELVIERIVPYTQELDIVNAGGFYPDTVEEQLDMMVMQTQQLADINSRSLTVPVGETGLELPSSDNREGQFLAFDASGDLVLSDGTGADAGLRTDLAADSGAALSGFLPAGTGAVPTTVQDKLREFISVIDFGADPTGLTNSTAAIQRAMKYGMDSFPGDEDFYEDGPGEPAAGAATHYESRDRRTIAIFFPAGLYTVSPEVFSSLAHARDAFVGFIFFGAGMKSSIIKLITGGGPDQVWFYKTTLAVQRYQGMAFRDLGFTSDDYRYANFASVYSSGGPKQFNVHSCLFRDIQTYMSTEGTGNADLNRCTNSWIEHFGPLLILNNGQSVEHDFGFTHLRSWAPHVDVRQHGGGNVNFCNGAVDLIWDERISPASGTYFFTHSSDASIGHGNCTYTWKNLRVEVEAYSKRPHVRGATDAAGYAAGVSTINLAATGSGAISIGDTMRISGTDRTIYTVTAGDPDVSNGGSVSFTPPLVEAIPALSTSIYTNEPPLGVVKTVSNTNANPRILIDNVNFVAGETRLIDNSGTVIGAPEGEFRRLYAFIMWPRKHVTIRGSTILLKNFFYDFQGSRTTSSPNSGGIVHIAHGVYDGINGQLPVGDSLLTNIHSRASYGGSAGRLITEGMSADHTTGSDVIRRVQDADPRWQSSFGAEQASIVKIVNFKHLNNGWPSAISAASGNGGVDHFLDVPPGVKALRIYVKKLASGANTDAYQLHLKVTDRTGALIRADAESTLAQFKDEHVIDIEHVNLEGITRICLCASGAWDSFSAPTDFYAYMMFV